MQTVTSKDGTKIAFDRQGNGPALILVDGALCYRSFGPMSELAKLLAPHFTVYNYDRRGRGDSGASPNGAANIGAAMPADPAAVDCEVEDIAALITEAGNSAYLCGLSSGAALALEAAIRLGNKVKKLAMYEAPYDFSPGSELIWKEYRQKLSESLAAGRRGDAAALFMSLVGMPAEQLEGMRQSPVWPMFEGVAPTLAYDAAVLGADRTAPLERAARVTQPALVMNGGASFPFMYDTAQTLAQAMPNAQLRTLEGQRHDVDVAVLAPVLVEFFNS